MAQRPDSDERRAAKHAYKKAEHDAARAHMVLDRASLDALIDYVAAALGAEACDNTLRATRRWAQDRGVDPEVLAASLGHFGGYCDCEVAANVEPAEIFR